MLINKFLLKVYSILLIICITVLIVLLLLGNKSRVGYLSEFNLESSNNNEYSYHFRIKYYSKFFRNSDIYGVYLDTNKIIQNNNFIKDIKINEKGSPFGILTSSKQLEYQEKIDNINYTLRLKTIFCIILSILILFDIYLYLLNKNYTSKILENRNKVLKVYAIVLLFYLIVICIFYLLGNIPHKGYLSDLELITSSPAGYVYKAKVNSKGFFSPNLLYEYSDKPLKLKSKPDYIKNYGYSLEINRMPDWYNASIGASAWNNEDGTFTVSNSTSWNGYGYDIIPSKGERYRVSVEAKRISGNSFNPIKYHLDETNTLIPIDSTYDIIPEYKVYSNEVDILYTKPNPFPHFTFYFPDGVINIKSIKLEQLSDNLFLKNNNEIIFTSTVNNINIDDIKNIKYTLSVQYDLLKQIICLFVILLLIYIIFIFVSFNLLLYLKSFIINNKKKVLKVYFISLLSLVFIVLVLSLLGNIYHKGYLSDFEIIAASPAGYVYKAKVNSKGFFSPNLLYEYSDKPLKLKSKPDYIKNYGYSLEINRMPDWYNTIPAKGLSASAWNNEDGTFTVSNSTSWNGYGYDIMPSKGERYRVSVEAKNINKINIEPIKYSLDEANNNLIINNTYMIDLDYKTYTSEINISDVKANSFPNFTFYFSDSTLNIKSIKIEQINDNIYIKNGNYIIFSSSKVIDNFSELNLIYYKLDINLKNYVLLILIILVLLMFMYKININKYIQFFIVLFIILCSNFIFNMFSLTPEVKFKDPDTYSDNIILDDLFIKNISPEGKPYFFFNIYRRNYNDAINTYKFNEDEVINIVKNNDVEYTLYKSCLGMQSHILKPLFNILLMINNDSHYIFRGLQNFSAVLNVIVFAIFFTFLAVEFGIIPISIMAIFTIITNIWITAFSRCIWFVPFTFILPMLIVAYFIYKYDFNKNNLLLFLILVLSIIFRLSYGYEYLPTLFVSTTLPVFYFSISRSYSIKKFMKYFLMISGICILGLIIVLIIHILALGSIDHIVDSLLKRTVNNVSDGGEVFNTSIFNILKIYFSDTAYLYPYIYSILIFIMIIIMRILLSSIYKDKFGFKISINKYFGLFVCVVISFFGVVSSMFIFKQHFYVHRHINYFIIWLPFLLLLYSLILYRVDCNIFIKIKKLYNKISNKDL